jgi:hypothetical protein
VGLCYGEIMITLKEDTDGRRVFYVDVGNMSADDAKKFIDEFKRDRSNKPSEPTVD